MFLLRRPVPGVDWKRVWVGASQKYLPEADTAAADAKRMFYRHSFPESRRALAMTERLNSCDARPIDPDVFPALPEPPTKAATITPGQVSEATPEQRDRIRKDIDSRLTLLTTVADGHRQKGINDTGYAVGGLAVYLPEEEQETVRARLEKVALTVADNNADSRKRTRDTVNRSFNDGLQKPLDLSTLKPPEPKPVEAAAPPKAPAPKPDNGLPPLVTLGEYLDAPSPAVDLLLPPFIQGGAIVLISGDGGSAKSMTAAEIAIRVAEAGHGVEIIYQEDPQGPVQTRFRRLTHSRQATRKLIHFRHHHFVQLDAPEWVEQILEDIRTHNLKLVVVDTLARSHKGNENTQQDIGRVFDAAVRMSAAGAAVVVVHHTNKQGETLGSVAIRNHCSLALLVTVAKPGLSFAEVTKAKYLHTLIGKRYSLRTVDVSPEELRLNWEEVAPKLDTSGEQDAAILKALPEWKEGATDGLSIKDLAEKLGINRNNSASLQSPLAVLKLSCRVRDEADGRWPVWYRVGEVKPFAALTRGAA